jgi:hydroxyacylglutathione hydrolase
MQVEQFRYGADNLGYLVYGGKTAMAIDGGAENAILSFVKLRNLELTYVANTHSHMDHTMGNQELLRHSSAAFLDFDTLMKEKQIEMDGEKIAVFHTPGHTGDSVCFYFDNILIAGDTLFNGKVGRCFTGDFPRFLTSIKTILKLPGETLVYAGHDYVEEYVEFARNLEPDNAYLDSYLKKYNPDHVCATLEDERRVDPFLRYNDDKIRSILKNRGLPASTEPERRESLMSLM